MANKCPNCGRPTQRTADWVCQWCGYPLLSRSFKKIDKTYKQLQEERQQIPSAPPEPEFLQAPEPVPPEPVIEVKQETVPVQEPEQITEPVPAPEPEPAPAEQKTVPPQEPVTETRPEPVEEPVAETPVTSGAEAQPVTETRPEPVEEPVAETPVTSGAEPEPVTETRPEPAEEAVAETPVTSSAEAQPETGPESAPVPEPEPEPEPQPAPPPAPEPGPEPQPAPLPAPEPGPEPQPAPPPELEPGPEPEPVPEPRVEAAPVVSPPPPVPEALPGEIAFTVDELNASYQEDRAGTHARLTDQVFRITGVVDKIFIREHLEIRYIVLRGTGQGDLWSVRCTFNHDNAYQLNGLSKGSTVTVRGKYDGYGKNIIVKDCSLIAG